MDGWQREPQAWDLVRRSVDRDPAAGRFLLTGSATPVEAPTHSGAGRIVQVRMRPMSLAERGLCAPTVSLAELLAGGRPAVEGSSPVGLTGYAEEIVRSGFPAIRTLTPRARRAQLDGYLALIVERDFPEQGHLVRRPPPFGAGSPAAAGRGAGTVGQLGRRPGSSRQGSLLGDLFESLVTLSVRTYAQAAEAAVYHLRTRNDDHEVDLIVERDDQRVVAIEVKLAASVSDADVVH